MQTFLMWRPSTRSEAGLPAVRERLVARFDVAETTVEEWSAGCANMLRLEISPEGWRAPSVSRDGSRVAAILGYPFNLETALASRGFSGPAPELLRLFDAIERDADGVVPLLSPGFVFAGAEPGRAIVQMDGLGFGQMFLMRNGEEWAFSNRLAAFEALGERLRPVRSEWATRCAVGWFPLNFSGYAGIEVPPPGAHFRIDASGALSERRIRALESWVHPAPMDIDAACNLAYEAFHAEIAGAARYWERPSAGLTGGRDSRVVVAALLRHEPAISARVRGASNNYDVRLARVLAERAGLALRVQEKAAFPPPDAARAIASIKAALERQAGHFDFDLRKTFLAREGSAVSGGRLHIMGQHAEIARSYYRGAIEARFGPGVEPIDGIERLVLGKNLGVLRRELRDEARETLRRAFRAYRDFGLAEKDALDFFYLNERTRRWASGGIHAQAGLVLAPFLNPGTVAATYSMDPDRRLSAPLHEFFLARDMPDWLSVPTEKELKSEETLRRKTEEAAFKAAPFWVRIPARLRRSFSKRIRPAGWRASSGRRDYDPALYWNQVGAPILRRALRQGGFWTEVLDPELAPRLAPDAVAVLAALDRERD